MRTKINFFLIFTLIYLNLINLNAQVSDTLSYKEKLNSGEYPPFIKLTNKDKIQFPIKCFVHNLIKIMLLI